MRRLLLIVWIAALVAGCSSGQATMPEQTQPGTFGPAPTTYAVGESATVTGDGGPLATITVTDVSEVEIFRGEGADAFNDEPFVAGYVFLVVHASYRSLSDGFNYNIYDWLASAGGEAINPRALLNVPPDELGSGTLAAGETVTGSVVFEVPKTGKVSVLYGVGLYHPLPVFEVVARA